MALVWKCFCDHFVSAGIDVPHCDINLHAHFPGINISFSTHIRLMHMVRFLFFIYSAKYPNYLMGDMDNFGRHCARGFGMRAPDGYEFVGRLLCAVLSDTSAFTSAESARCCGTDWACVPRTSNAQDHVIQSYSGRFKTGRLS